ncbi:hypothetical protein SAY86_020154 [Trapa natans]|uniref:AT-hook motif nuclear-localized protein n=1 Tax=Trapa natans TaxID=22666 RepID=A0AAN7LMZ3_TRANT|nr:hypothetical protein SAY86_020154 [Trapa natans]
MEGTSSSVEISASAVMEREQSVSTMRAASQVTDAIMAGVGMIQTPPGGFAFDGGIGQPSAAPIDEEAAGGSAAMSTLAVGRKRGRPKKYEFLESGESQSDLASPRPNNRGRGRPKGSMNKQPLPTSACNLIETTGMDFTPHVTAVQAGEDIIKKVASYSHGCDSVLVMSATGDVLSVVIRQAARPDHGSTVTMNGTLQILSLQGLLSFRSGVPSGLNILVAQPNGYIFGGHLAGPLIAAGPVQLILGTFKENIPKERKMKRPRKSPLSAPSDAAKPDKASESTNPSNAFDGALLSCDVSCKIPASAGLEELAPGPPGHASEDHFPRDN